MDLRALELDFAAGRASARVADAGGERMVALPGDAGRAVLAAAAPLAAALMAGEPRGALALDFVARRARLSPGAPASEVLVAGEGFGALAPSLAPLVRAALAGVRGPRIDDPHQPLDAGSWGGLYRGQGDGWELGRAAPPLVRWVEAHPLQGVRALVVGCGRGHEARLLARAGAEVTALDFAPEAIAAARALAAEEGVRIDFRQADLFAPGAAGSAHDLVLEHCCFCAIRPEQRPDYVRVVAGALRPGGLLLGLFWGHGRPGGPPFSVTADELRAAFLPPFTLGALEVPRDSVAGRMDQELLIELRR